MQTLANDHIPRAWFEKLEVPFAVMLPTFVFINLLIKKKSVISYLYMHLHYIHGKWTKVTKKMVNFWITILWNDNFYDTYKLLQILIRFHFLLRRLKKKNFHQPPPSFSLSFECNWQVEVYNNLWDIMKIIILRGE